MSECRVCDRGQCFRCDGSCGCWRCPLEKRRFTNGPVSRRTKRAPKRNTRRYVPTGRPRGAPHGARGIPGPMQHAIAVALLAGEASKPKIAARAGCTYEQVRTIERNLKALACG